MGYGQAQWRTIMRSQAIVLSLLLLVGTGALAQDFSMEVLHKGTQSWNGAALPGYPDSAPEITIVKMVVQPGAPLPEHLHPVINGGYMISGELTVYTENGEETVFHAGDATLEVVNTWHSSRNTGDTVTEIIVFYVGTPGVEITQRRE
jgi:quercetin dioxygenase-like cupin family protein